MKRAYRITSIFLTLILLTVMAAPRSVQAAGNFIYVNTTRDIITNDPAIADPSVCSLREATIAANQNRKVGGCVAGSSTGMDIIILGISTDSKDYGNTGKPISLISLTKEIDPNNDAYGGDLDLTGDTAIYGNQTTGTEIGYRVATANPWKDRIFHINTSGSVTLSHLTLQSGTARENDCGANGAFACGGAIFVESGALYLEYSQLNTNHANDLGGAIFVNKEATLNATMTTFAGNNAGAGGAIKNLGSINISNSFFSFNVAEQSNLNGGYGGAINHNSEGGSASLVNDTFTQNIAPQGAAVYSSTRLQILNSTFVDNTASDLVNGASLNLYGLGFIQNSLVFQRANASTTCRIFGSEFVSQGGNIEDRDACQFHNAATDRNFADAAAILEPTLKTLPNSTNAFFMPLTNSEALGLGFNCPHSDQRGNFYRREFAPQSCDSGSIEFAAKTSIYQVQLPKLFR